MSDSPLMRRTRERLARQRQQQREQWEMQPAKLRKSMLRWMLRIIGFMILLGLIAYRMGGGRTF